MSEHLPITQDFFYARANVLTISIHADPLQGLAISTEGFGRIGKRSGEMSLPSVIVQEGGYLSAALGTNLSAFLAAFRLSHKC